jgi:pyruvate/2-oxoglutarate/acetoin dehydrogenase E1 component
MSFDVASNAELGEPSVTVYRDALAQAMEQALATRPNSIIIGQGVSDHKGTFGTTLGLADRYGPGRVIDTPLCEETVAGICIGAALAGDYPINTHIRADFALVAMNQIVNLAAKYKYMFGGRFDVPMLLRLVVGRSWGQGAQHSQSPQSLFAHIPGLVVIMPSSPASILRDYAHAVAHHRGPVISLEHRLMYDLAFRDEQAPACEPFSSICVRAGKDVTIVASSIMVLEALRAAEHLATHGIDCEIIDLNCISHPSKDLIIESVAKTGKLLVADTSWLAYGVAAEIARLVLEEDPRLLSAPMVSMGMAPCPCPTAKSLEDAFYPNQESLIGAIVRLARGEAAVIPLPRERSMAEYYKRFKGPF